MGTVRQVLVGLFSVAFLLGGMTMVMPLGNEAEASGYSKKYFKKYYKPHKRVSNKELKDLILMLKDQIENSPTGGGDGNHTLRWDTVLDTTNGDNIPTAGCNSDRFKCIFGGDAVLDFETGLVWVKAPGETDEETGITEDDWLDWNDAREECTDEREIGGRKGWRLPSVHELASLIDPAFSTPSLPPNHPFIDIVTRDYWTATTYATNSSNAWDVNFSNGTPTSRPKSSPQVVWCVRGGHNDGSEY